jgi:hypothetical protein
VIKFDESSIDTLEGVEEVSKEGLLSLSTFGGVGEEGGVLCHV